MGKFEIRRLEGEEIAATFHWMNQYAFRSSPPIGSSEEIEKVIEGRKDVIYYALFEDGRSVAAACVAATPMLQNVRGKVFPMGGVFDVVTRPEDRRKGYAREMVKTIYQGMHEMRKAFSTLYPFRESFYERMGYVGFPLAKKYNFKTTDLTPLLKHDLQGEVELRLSGEGYDRYRDFLQDYQKGVHGFAYFEFPEDRMRKSETSWIAFAKIEGQVVGLMVYQLKGEVVTEYTMRAARFYTSDPRGRYLLLDWIARHVDQAKEVELWLPAFEQPETWFTDLKVQPSAAWIAPMGRVLNVAKIGGLHAGEGKFSAEISDPYCPWNEGIWNFESVEGVLKVEKAESADFRLNIQGLSALVYGTNDPEEFAIRGWGEVPSEWLSVLRKMFPPAEPHLHEYF